ncbi:MAG: alkaline phosphatase family protein, partial [Acidimicrobiales bacterium]
LADAAARSLPNVSYLDPRFEDEGTGTSGDDHPHADIRAGDAFLAQAFHAVSSGPNWDRTVFVLTYDEWGGFYDHVVPPRATATSPLDKDLVDGRALLGFRVPCIVASPWTKGDPHHPRVDHRLYDHTSILKLITSTFGLKPLAARDASRSPKDPANLASLLARGAGDGSVPASIPTFLPPPVVDPCGPTNPMPVDSTWGALRASRLLDGWPV